MKKNTHLFWQVIDKRSGGPMTEEEHEMIAPKITTSKELTWLLGKHSDREKRKRWSKQFEHQVFVISESLITLRKIRFAVAHDVPSKAEPLSSGHRLWGFFS